MSYRQINSVEMLAGKPITAQLLAQIRDNLAGISAGGAVDLYPVNTNAFASNALTGSATIQPGTIPGDDKLQTAIDNTKLAAASVDFSNLKVAAASFNAAAGAIATGAVTSTNRYYILGWQTYCNASCTQYQAGPGSGEVAGNTADNWLYNTSPEMHFWVYERSGVPGATATVSWWYISASPPYELDGRLVPVYCWVRQRANGSIREVHVGDDPPWVGAGGTALAATEYRGRRPWVRRRKPIDRADLAPGLLADAGHRAAILARLRSNAPEEFEEYEITTARKNADMAARPHPWPRLDAGERAILLDPIGDMAYDLAELHREGVAGQLVAQGDITLGDEYELPEQPPGVTLLRAAWR